MENGMRLIAIGRVKNDLKEISLALDQGDLVYKPELERMVDISNLISRIVIEERFMDALEGIEGFSHIMVIFWTGCRVEEPLLVHPAGQVDMPKKGVFATRSPARPNPLAVTTVEILWREGRELIVKGLDAIDGTPVIDIKPHLPSYDAPVNPRLSDWMQELEKRFHPE